MGTSDHTTEDNPVIWNQNVKYEDNPHEENSRVIKPDSTDIKEIGFPEVARHKQFNRNSLCKWACTPSTVVYKKQLRYVIIPLYFSLFWNNNYETNQKERF